jgi:hypothetical protein
VKSKNGIILFAVNGLARSVRQQNALFVVVNWRAWPAVPTKGIGQ